MQDIGEEISDGFLCGIVMLYTKNLSVLAQNYTRTNHSFLIKVNQEWVQKCAQKVEKWEANQKYCVHFHAHS